MNPSQGDRPDQRAQGATSAPPAEDPPPRTARLAVVAFVICLLFLPLLPIILGAVASGRIRGSQGRVKGLGLARAAMWLGIIQLVGMLLGLVVGHLRSAYQKAAATQALNNMSSLGALLFEFDQDWGSVPSKQIYQANRDNFRGLRFADDSNFYLGMLIAGGYTESEEVFYARCPATRGRRPDNVIDSPDHLLATGECGLGYVMLAGDKAQAWPQSGGPDRPLLVTPLALDGGGPLPRFDRASMDGKALLLMWSNQVVEVSIDRSDRGPDSTKPAISHAPKNLDPARNLGPGHRFFDHGPGTIWGDDQPLVKAPRPAPR